MKKDILKSLYIFLGITGGFVIAAIINNTLNNTDGYQSEIQQQTQQGAIQQVNNLNPISTSSLEVPTTTSASHLSCDYSQWKKALSERDGVISQLNSEINNYVSANKEWQGQGNEWQVEKAKYDTAISSYKTSLNELLNKYIDINQKYSSLVNNWNDLVDKWNNLISIQSQNNYNNSLYTQNLENISQPSNSNCSNYLSNPNLPQSVADRQYAQCSGISITVDPLTCEHYLYDSGSWQQKFLNYQSCLSGKL